MRLFNGIWERQRSLAYKLSLQLELTNRAYRSSLQMEPTNWVYKLSLQIEFGGWEDNCDEE